VAITFLHRVSDTVGAVLRDDEKKQWPLTEL